MAKFQINEAALQKIAQDAVKQAVIKIDRDMSSYRGKPREEVKLALERVMRRHGLQPNPGGSDFERMAEVISSGGHLR
jgi:hypothetical protein